MWENDNYAKFHVNPMRIIGYSNCNYFPIQEDRGEISKTSQSKEEDAKGHGAVRLKYWEKRIGRYLLAKK